jgi:hypothetical protein
MSQWAMLTGIGRLVLLFWAAWLSVVVTTNLLNVLVAVGTLPHSFAFTSGNWQWINQVMDPLAVPRALQGAFFAGAILWEGVAAVLFWRAVIVYRGRSIGQEHAALAACAVNLALWAAFQVLDEVFLAYQPEQVHRAIFLNQIATIILLAVLSAMGGPRHHRESDESPTDPILPAE